MNIQAAYRTCDGRAPCAVWRKTGGALRLLMQNANIAHYNR